MHLDRPKTGSFGLLIAVNKTSPDPDFFITKVTPGGVADAPGLIDEGTWQNELSSFLSERQEQRVASSERSTGWRDTYSCI